MKTVKATPLFTLCLCIFTICTCQFWNKFSLSEVPDVAAAHIHTQTCVWFWFPYEHILLLFSQVGGGRGWFEELILRWTMIQRVAWSAQLLPVVLKGTWSALSTAVPCGTDVEYTAATKPPVLSWSDYTVTHWEQRDTHLHFIYQCCFNATLLRDDSHLQWSYTSWLEY